MHVQVEHVSRQSREATLSSGKEKHSSASLTTGIPESKYHLSADVEYRNASAACGAGQGKTEGDTGAVRCAALGPLTRASRLPSDEHLTDL